MKKLTIILDPAHGADVKGKQSPDGTHKEYKWSRERVKSLRERLILLDYPVYITTESENEPGLSKRKNFASGIMGKKKLLISLHNNAKGSDGKWKDARGVCVYTSKGVTDSDICADYFIENFRSAFDIRIREFNKKYLEKDFEENFTVLMGNYMAVLIEWLFQDNVEDVKLLKDSEVNKRFEDAIISAINKINEHFFGK